MPPPSADSIVNLVQALGAGPNALLPLACKVPLDLVTVITRSPGPAFLRAICDLTDGELRSLAAHARALRAGSTRGRSNGRRPANRMGPRRRGR